MSIEFDPYEQKLIAEDGSPLPRITGIETEYGIAHPDSAKFASKEEKNLLAQKVGEMAGKIRLHEFESDGVRMYLDINQHPEYSTPEGNVFIDTAHRTLHGHFRMAKIYQDAVDQFASKSEKETGERFRTEAFSMVTNTLSPTGVSWGNHENYLARRELKPGAYVTALAAHHLSRIVWSGTGSVWVKPDDTKKYHFEISEKADHIWDVCNNSTMGSRPLVNMRDEPLADKHLFRRIHNVTGESNMSAFATALRLATGSIVLRACELGVRFDDLMPAVPLRAIRTISHDPTLKALIPLEDGRTLTGIELQRAIAERAIDSATGAEYLTEEEVEWGKEWIAVLDDLERDPNSCADRVDWVVKQKLIKRELEAKGRSKQSASHIAWAKAIDYHMILPREGNGMKLVRKGYFRCSPDEQQLEDGIPLPQTRAKIRGEILGLLKRKQRGNREYEADWETVKLYGGNTPPSIKLSNPYAVEDERAEAFLQKIA